MFCKSVFKNSAKLTGKYLCQRFFFNKVARLLLFFLKMTLIFRLTVTCKLKVNALKKTSDMDAFVFKLIRYLKMCFQNNQYTVPQFPHHFSQHALVRFSHLLENENYSASGMM